VPNRQEGNRTSRELARADRRWFLLVAAGFVGATLLIGSVHAVYRATGPHPGFTLFLRRLKRMARRMIPRVRWR
jgi:hypothetical protein